MTLSPVEHISSETLQEGQAYRLFHGRGHSFIGCEMVNIDWLSPVILITLYKEVDTVQLQHWVEQLVARYAAQCRSIQVQYRCRELAPIEVRWGEAIEHCIVQEHGLSYHIELGRAQNTGLFLDMATGREWVKAHAAGANVLNLFSYTCAFSVAALAGGAEKVVNIDMSKRALRVGRDNHRLNQQDTAKVKLLGHDIFKSWGKLRKLGPYGMLIVDPPSLQLGSVDVRKDYARIVRRIPELVQPGGWVILCLNAPELGPDFIQTQVDQHSPDCQFQNRVLPPAVFKEVDPDKSLKVMVYRYHPESDS